MSSFLSITGPTNYKTDYFMRMFYSDDRTLRSTTAGGRASKSDSSLALADTIALKKAVKQIDNSLNKDDKNSLVEVSALVNTYNNMIESTHNKNSQEFSKLQKKVDSLLNKYKDELDKMGLSKSDGGALEFNKTRFSNTDIDQLKDLFSSKSKFGSELKKYVGKMAQEAYNYNSLIDLKL